MLACTPALNWRDVRPPDSGVAALFPCKPDRFSRSVPLAGATVPMVLMSCSAVSANFALGYAEMVDPTRATLALTELRAAATGNISGRITAQTPLAMNGMTPNALAERLTIEGQRDDGRTISEQAAFFTKGRRVYQASIVADKIDVDAANTFFTALKLEP